MNFHFTLEKVLSVKENEKNMLEIEYRNAYQDFEQIAKALYDFLQQKETLERKQLDGMTKGTAIEEIRKLQISVELLERKIDHYEVLYRNARQYAEQKKGLLLEQAIDVKRYEKLRDLEYDKFLKKNKAEEMSKLDEISTIRHLQQ